MCGIIAGISKSNVIHNLIKGLKKLEYRGYDSSGLAWINSEEISRSRAVGRVTKLEKKIKKITTKIGIAHTRWATHGEVSEKNAHPHMSFSDELCVCVVHNGIIENYTKLKKQLIKRGYLFSSSTDTEVIAHLLHYERKKNDSLIKAINEVRKKLVGAYAIVAISNKDINKICSIKNGASLIIGSNKGLNKNFYFSSDPFALSSISENIIYLEDDDLVELSFEKIRIYDKNLNLVTRKINKLLIKENEVSLGPYNHFMQKEIHEQPGVIAATIENIINTNSLTPELFGIKTKHCLSKIENIKIVACGTSYHAGLVALHWLESIANITVSVEIASEFRYRKSFISKNTLLIAISQSGETADTLAAVSHAKKLGIKETLAICNVQESSLIRKCSMFFLTRAGQEIGVASTKAFTTQLAALFVFTLILAKTKKLINETTEKKLINELRHLPTALSSIIAAESEFKKWVPNFKNKNNVLFLGRGIHSPIAMEGALKLKEISYIHAEAYAAGELKHGPLALIDADMPIIAVAPNDKLISKLKNNLEEVSARKGKLFIIADQGLGFKETENMKIITLGDHAGHLSPILHVIPLQILAYHIACAKGNDVDKPRNLAKSVTVE